MKIRTRFALLFAFQAVVLAGLSIAFVFSAIAGGNARAENEFVSVSRRIEENIQLAGAASASDRTRLDAALAAIESLRAKEAAGRLFRSQAIVDSVASVGLFVLGMSIASILLVSMAARPLTRRLEELSKGASRVSADRLFRFPVLSEGEFAPVFGSFNTMLNLIAAQELRLIEASRLEGWKEVSSFLFHQLRTPLSALDLAGRNVETVLTRVSEGTITEREALNIVQGRALAIRTETERIGNLLDRFKQLAGLTLQAPGDFTASELSAACSLRIPKSRGSIMFSGDSEATIHADRRLAEEALMNLLVNATEACTTPPALIRVTARRTDAGTELSVTDDNGRVDEAVIERLGKERFSTKTNGTGLGLLFVTRIAALHGGSLTIDRTEDGGFQARLLLPEGGPA
ncbi:MAG: ATP-binding protein [Treponemataceae bacterium]